MEQYFRIDYTDQEWWLLLCMFGEKLPPLYNDCFDEYGEYAEEYHDIFTTDIYQVKREEG